MMNDLKKTLRFMKYGDQFMVYMALAVIWFIVGVLGLVGVIASANKGNAEPYHVFLIFVMFPPLMLVQCFASLEATGLVASSGKRRFVSLKGQNLLSISGVGVMFLLVILIVLIQSLLAHRLIVGAGGIILCAGIAASVLLIYIAVVYKSFVFGIILFAGCYFVYGIFGSYISYKNPSLLMGLLLGSLAFILGAVVSCLIRAALYKMPVSKTALGAEMRKYM
ncbi:MAG: hypothetical protein PUC12_01525 [Clostridiales bacterium]|nr:hypothetical protein [Clostridiales bacterium]